MNASLSTSIASLNASLSTSIASLTSTVASQNSSLSASIEFLNTSVATISDEVSNTLQIINTYKPVWNIIGKTFEYVVLERLRERKGTEYARGIKIKNLVDLAKESTLQLDDVLFSEKSFLTSTNDDDEITSIRLAQAAKCNVDALSRWAEQHSTGDNPPSKMAEKDL